MHASPFRAEISPDFRPMARGRRPKPESKAPGDAGYPEWPETRALPSLVPSACLLVRTETWVTSACGRVPAEARAPTADTCRSLGPRSAYLPTRAAQGESTNR